MTNLIKFDKIGLKVGEVLARKTKSCTPYLRASKQARGCPYLEDRQAGGELEQLHPCTLSQAGASPANATQPQERASEKLEGCDRKSIFLKHNFQNFAHCSPWILPNFEKL